MGWLGFVGVIFFFGIIMLLVGLISLPQDADLMNIWCGSDCINKEESSAGTLLVMGIAVLSIGVFTIKRIWFR